MQVGHTETEMLNTKTLIWKDGLAGYKNHALRDNKSIIFAAKVFAEPYFYVFGGFQNLHTVISGDFSPFITDEIVRYDIVLNEWKLVGHMQHKRFDHRKELQVKRLKKTFGVRNSYQRNSDRKLFPRYWWLQQTHWLLQ